MHTKLLTESCYQELQRFRRTICIPSQFVNDNFLYVLLLVSGTANHKNKHSSVSLSTHSHQFSPMSTSTSVSPEWGKNPIRKNYQAILKNKIVFNFFVMILLVSRWSIEFKICCLAELFKHRDDAVLRKTLANGILLNKSTTPNWFSKGHDTINNKRGETQLFLVHLCKGKKRYNYIQVRTAIIFHLLHIYNENWLPSDNGS